MIPSERGVRFGRGRRRISTSVGVRRVRMVRIFGHFVPVTTAILGIAEAFVIGLSFCFGVALLDAADADAQGFTRFALPLFLAFAILMMMHSSGLYNAEALVDLRRTF